MNPNQELNKARKILGISKDAKVEEVKKRYKDLAKKWHPDINKNQESNNIMKEINQSYELIMKQEFGIIDPWEDYPKWWWKQYGNDPCWGNPITEELDKIRKYAGIKKSNLYLNNTNSESKKDVAKEFLHKNNIFAVVGVSKNPKKYGNKIYKELKFGGYRVYPINPLVEEIDGDKCYSSISELPKMPDVVNIVVPPDIAKKVVKEAIGLGIKKIWLQPGSESKILIEICKKNNIQALHNMCIMIESRKRA